MVIYEIVFSNNCNLTQIIDELTRKPSNTLLDVIATKFTFANLQTRDPRIHL